MSKLINQPSAEPTRKIQAVGIAGSITTILVFALGQFGVELPVEVAVALTSVIIFAAGYQTKSRSK